MSDTTGETITSFTDLRVWQSGHRLVILIYELTKRFPLHEQYGLANQIRRAAVSVTSNIAEGFRRETYKEKLRFYSMAASSLTEVENQLIIACDVDHISQKEFEQAQKLAVETSKMLLGLMKATRAKIRSSTFDIRHSQEGSSLLEVVVATGLVSLVVTALVLTSLFTVRMFLRAHRDSIAAEIATAQIETLRHLPATSLANQTNGPLIGDPQPSLTDLPAGVAEVTITDYQGQTTVKHVEVAISYRAGSGSTRTIRMTTIIGAGGISG